MLLENWVVKSIDNPEILFADLTWGHIDQDDDGDFEIYAWDDDAGETHLQVFLQEGGNLERRVSKHEKLWKILDKALDDYEGVKRGELITLFYNSSLRCWKDYTGWRNPADEIEEYVYDPFNDRHALVRSGHDSGAPYLGVYEYVEGPLEWQQGLPKWKESSTAYNQRWSGHPKLTGQTWNEASFMYPEVALR